MKYYFFIFCLHTKIKIEVGNIGTDKNQIAIFILRNMITNMPGAICPFNEDQFVFWVKMPVEQVIEPGIEQQPEGTVGVGVDDVEYGFHALDLYELCLFYGVES